MKKRKQFVRQAKIADLEKRLTEAEKRISALEGLGPQNPAWLDWFKKNVPVHPWPYIQPIQPALMPVLPPNDHFPPWKPQIWCSTSSSAESAKP